MHHSVEDFCAATANISLWLRKYFFSGATTTVDTQIATHKFIAALQIGVGGEGKQCGGGDEGGGGGGGGGKEWDIAK